MNGYRNAAFADSFLRGMQFVSDLQQRDKDNEFRQQEFGLRLRADDREQSDFDYRANSRPDATLARKAGEAGMNDTIGLAGFNAKKRASDEAGLLTPEQSAELARLGYTDKTEGYRVGALQRASDEAGMLTPEEAGKKKVLGLQGLDLENQSKRESIATSRYNRSQPKNVETFGNPVDELDAAGKKIRVQYGNHGSRRVVDGAIPAGKTGEMGVDAKRAETTLRGIDNTLTAYRDLVDKYGAEIAPGAVKGQITGAYANLQMELKNLYELGALTGPDVEVLGRMITPPDAIGANLNPWARSQMLAQLDEVSKVIQEKKKAFSGTYGVQFPAAQNGLKGPQANGKYWKLWE